MFLVFSGLVTGVGLWYDAVLANGTLVVFPPIRQSFAEQIRLCFVPLAREAFWTALLNLRWQILAYFVMGELG